MPSFKLKPEHIKIMTDLNFRISILIDSKDRYRPAIDVKRPFGNSGPTTNVCEIMGWHCDEESGEYAAEDIEKAERKPDYVLKNVAEIADILKAHM